MVQAVVKISDKANKVINKVKETYGLKDKSEAINHIILEYETEIRPHYKKKLLKILKGKHLSKKEFESNVY